jgi:hypothetical protein
MRVLLTRYGSRGEVEARVKPAMQSRALGAEPAVGAPADFAAEGCDDLVATGVIPAGVWR